MPFPLPLVSQQSGAGTVYVMSASNSRGEGSAMMLESSGVRLAGSMIVTCVVCQRMPILSPAEGVLIFFWKVANVIFDKLQSNGYAECHLT